MQQYLAYLLFHLDSVLLTPMLQQVMIKPRPHRFKRDVYKHEFAQFTQLTRLVSAVNVIVNHLRLEFSEVIPAPTAEFFLLQLELVQYFFLLLHFLYF